MAALVAATRAAIHDLYRPPYGTTHVLHESRHREERSDVAIQGNVTDVCCAALDRHAAKRRLAMTVYATR